MRAAAFAPEVARLLGVRVGRMLTAGLGAGGARRVAGRAARRAGRCSSAPNNFDALLVFGFTAAVIGGLDSPPGAVVGGLLLGLALSYVSGYIGAEVVTLGALAILIAVLMVRPTGLFSRDAGAAGLTTLTAPPRAIAVRVAGRGAVRAHARRCSARSTTSSSRPWPTTSSRSPG